MKIPENIISSQPQRVQRLFRYWEPYMEHNLEFWKIPGDLDIHTQGHCERVLMHALRIGEARHVTDDQMLALSLASIFHDTRRKDNYLDTGHGARAAGYFKKVASTASPLGATRLAPPPKGEGSDYNDKQSCAIRKQDNDKLDNQSCAQRPHEESACHSIPSPLGGGVRGGAVVACHSIPSPLGGGVRGGAVVAMAYAAIFYHDRDDELGEKYIRTHFAEGKERDEALEVYHIFKDADALDRLRLGTWCLDPKYLRTKEAKDMQPFAQKLVELTIPHDELMKTYNATEPFRPRG